MIIKSYVQFLHAKLQFHKEHPAFNGSFDYEEYVTLRGIEDPNEGYVRYVIVEMFTLAV